MPIRMSAEEALETSRGNPDRMYPKPGRNEERIRPFVEPGLRPGFSFGMDSKFFAAGSCFARNIEKALRFIGADVLSSPVNLPCPPSYQPAMNLFHKYTVHSILNELRWAFSPNRPAAEDLLIEAKPGEYADLQLTSGLTAPLAEAAALRNRFNDTFKAAREADVLVITLGLVECWYDCDLRVYLNAPPTPRMIKAAPGRFEFHVLGYDDIYATLEELYALLQANCPKQPKMLFTVSPVPLIATFRSEDVLVANCYSKSVQRAALDAFVERHEVDYFPSYEMVVYSDMHHAWADNDYRHPRQEIVDRIMAKVLLAYAGESREQALLDARGRATAYINARDFKGVAEAIRPFAERYGYENDDLMMLYGRALSHLGDRAEAARVFRAIAERGGEHAPKAGEMADFQESRIAKNGATAAAAGSARDRAMEVIASLRERIGDDPTLDELESFVSAAGEAPALNPEKAAKVNAELRARDLIKSRKYADALAFAEEALGQWPDSESLAWSRAVSLRLTGAHRAALDQFLDIAGRETNISKLASRNAILTAGKMDDPDLLASIRARHDRMFPGDDFA